jgi:O-antigen/teichoic acid export membrane protein
VTAASEHVDTGRAEAAASDDGRLRAETLAEGFAFLAVLTVAQRAVGLLREVLFCRWMAPDDLGQWSLCFGFFLLAAPVVVCGLPGSFGRYVEYYRQRGLLRPFLVRTTAVSSLLAAAGIAAVLLARQPIAWLVFGDPTRAPLIVLLAFGLVGLVMFNFLVELFAALRLARLVYGLQLVTSLLFAALGLALFCAWQASAAALIIAYALACVMASLGGLFYLARVWRTVTPASRELTHSALWSRLLPFALWLWLTNVVVNLFERADCYMIMHVGGFGQQLAETLVGNYHTSRVIPLLMVSVAGLLSGLLLPHLSHAWEQGRRDVAVRRLLLTYKLSALAFMVGSVVLLIGSPLLFGWALAGKYDAGLAVLPWTLIYCFWFSLSLIAQNYLWCVERARLVTACYVGGLLLNVALNLILLPWLGLVGAVLATAAGNAVALVVVHLLNRRWGMRVPFGVWLVSLLPLALALGAWPAAAVLLITLILAARTELLFTREERGQVGDTLMGYLWQLRRLAGVNPPAAAEDRLAMRNAGLTGGEPR